MKFWRPVAALAVLLALAVVTGCSTPTPSGSGAGRLRVTASSYPFQFVAERVGLELVSVTNLTQSGAEPHDLELAPRQVAALGEVDLLIYQKGFQPAVDAAVATVPPKRVVDTASFLTLKPAALGQEDDETPSDGVLDPHTWLDPHNVITIAEHVRDALSEAMPQARDTFAANTAALVGDLTALDGAFSTGLKTCERTVFVTSHQAFGYLAGRYHLEQVGIRGVDPDTEPSAARIAAVQHVARANGVTTIFFETLVSPAVAESIAGDLGLRTDVLDPLEGLSADSRGADYLEVMRSNLSALQKANGCS